ncbi:hypothetical protein CDL15_Pgr004014 [Punica granatum]|uniref:Legume lectin domain-containing protein n=1 Tax=Punica granatum TaxID=22663 RepID=A0A218XEE1_PUNGR|nr:hypothetical protein CDL15_Pgr004014 [Punica granatum]
MSDPIKSSLHKLNPLNVNALRIVQAIPINAATCTIIVKPFDSAPEYLHKLLPRSSDGQYLGVTNASIDGSTFNRLLAIELGTHKQDGIDSQDNNKKYVGLDINSVRSRVTSPSQSFYSKAGANPSQFATILRKHCDP